MKLLKVIIAFVYLLMTPVMYDAYFKIFKVGQSAGYQTVVVMTLLFGAVGLFFNALAGYIGDNGERKKY
jgi:hypothetical protein